ncbi:MAG: hypothetical protein FWE23_05710 [Chitinivibrionia bacterium]|nr:hypothetical protein [Chitinivibrionia bacterium]
MYKLKTNPYKTQREIEGEKVIKALNYARELAKLNGTSKMTDEEINAEIAAARKERREMEKLIYA